MQSVVELWKRLPGDFFCLSTKSGAGKWTDNFFKRSQLGNVREFIRDNSDKDIYFCPHGFTTKERLKKYAVIPKLLWADLDEIDPAKIKHIKPTIAIESSPGRFVGLWMIDRDMTESVNRRLTYLLGADKGGWDLTQVLRVPGTVNYKYQSNPRVRLLWEDGPVYRLRDIERRLPEEADSEDGDAFEIYRKYEKKLSPMARRELMHGKPTPGKRSEVFWRLVNECVEAGMSREEAYIILKASPWNKFRGRSSEIVQLNRELDKVYKKKFTTTATKNGYSFLQTSLADVDEENISWIWYPYLARGEVTILEGDPGVGKSYLMQMVSKAIADGERLPSPRTSRVQGKIAYFDVENTAATVTKKRLKHNDCQHPENFFQEEEPFSIDDEDAVKHVYEAIEELRPVLVVFDTINLYIGRADIGKATETTQALSRFKDIARRFNCSVVLVRHLTKGNVKEKALYRGQGNIAFAGVSRIIMTLGTDPEDRDTKVLAVTKINLAPYPKALTYTVRSLPDTLKDQDRSKFTWGEFVELTSDEILGVPAHEKGENAVEFLREALDDGPRKASEIETMAEKRAISARTLQRAAVELEVVRKQRGFGKGKSSFWELP